MSYGFNVLHLPKIVARLQIPNKKSVRVMEKLGTRFDKFSKDRHGIDIVCYVKNKFEVVG